MPKYKNETSELKMVYGKPWEPGAERITNYFIPDELGLSKVDGDPAVPPPCMSAGVISIAAGQAQEIYVPMCEKFVATFVCSSGEAVIRHNDSGSPAIPVGPGAGYRIFSNRRFLEKFVVEAGSGGAIAYDIERVE
jgi:hypothetical protein